MRDGIYVVEDKRSVAEVRCTPIAQVWPEPKNGVLSVKNTDGNLWLSLPFPDSEELPGSYDDVESKAAKVVTPVGAVTFRWPTHADYTAITDEYDGEMPDAHTDEEIQEALRKTFFSFDMF